MQKTLIIAEAGVNHNGNIDLAKKMIDSAKASGADIVKFQTGFAENIISKFAPKAEYQEKTTGKVESQLDMVKKLLLPLDDFIILKKYCDQAGITFLSTPFDLESIDFLDQIGMHLWKIPSGEITNLPYLVKIAQTGYPIVMSTGMCEIQEIEAAVAVLRENGAGEISLLHCTTEYPAPMLDVNLKAMNTLHDIFHVPVGYSDHTKGIEIPIAAVARGATIIEKHFTLDRNMQGPDHKASLEPNELKAMVDAIRNIEKALGDGVKAASPSEQKNIAVVRKSIVAKCRIEKGTMFSEQNITTKRPGTGISPMKWFDVIGRRAIRDFEEDELIVI